MLGYSANTPTLTERYSVPEARPEVNRTSKGFYSLYLPLHVLPSMLLPATCMSIFAKTFHTRIPRLLPHIRKPRTLEVAIHAC
jgi:hypothetical protein